MKANIGDTKEKKGREESGGQGKRWRDVSRLWQGRISYDFNYNMGRREISLLPLYHMYVQKSSLDKSQTRLYLNSLKYDKMNC